MSEELTGALAPPMANGEVLFDAPWQGRVFGMARALADAGVYTWDDFRACLIARIGAADRAAGDAGRERAYEYYEHFLAALEDLLVARDLLDPLRLERRLAELAQRPHGHDHAHHHGHDHDH